MESVLKIWVLVLSVPATGAEYVIWGKFFKFSVLNFEMFLSVNQRNILDNLCCPLNLKLYDSRINFLFYLKNDLSH